MRGFLLGTINYTHGWWLKLDWRLVEPSLEEAVSENVGGRPCRLDVKRFSLPFATYVVYGKHP